MLPSRVLDAISRYAMFSPGQRAGVAVSGGADSVCLLHLLHELAPRWNLRLSVIHIEHGIRGAASRADADFVRDLAKRFALPFHFHQANVPSMHDNLEQAARHVRLAFFRDLVDSGAVDRIATGHTRSDQAETVLYRVLRGSGLTGLAGIRPVADPGIVRPLLYCTREEVRAWLRERDIDWREDETNNDPNRARNRIRRDLLPRLRQEFNPNVEDALANLAEIALDATPAHPSGASPSYLPVSGITRPAIRSAIESVKGDLRQIGFQHVEAVLNMARSANGHGHVHLPGVDVLRSFDCLRFAPPRDKTNPTVDFALPVAPPQTVEIPNGGGQIEFQVIERQGTSAFAATCDNLIEELDWQRIVSNSANAAVSVLELRNWRPGDRYRRVGQTHEQKLKLMFQETRVPLWDRRGWPVLTAQGVIVWCRRFGPAAGLAPGPCARAILRISDTNRTGP